MPDHAVEDGAVFRQSQLGGVFFGDHGVVRKRLDQLPADQGLAAKVGDRDGALVVLGENIPGNFRRDGPAKPGRLAHRANRNPQLTSKKSVVVCHTRQHGSKTGDIRNRTAAEPLARIVARRSLQAVARLAAFSRRTRPIQPAVSPHDSQVNIDDQRNPRWKFRTYVPPVPRGA